MNRDISAVGNLLEPLLAKLGIANLTTLTELTEQWDTLAGSPWAGNSTPQVIRHKELVVEANSNAGVRMLRYAAESLAKRLSDHFGDGVIDTVRVVAPSR